MYSEWNICVKVNKNRLKGSGGMERTQNSRIYNLTFTCDIDLESR